MLQSMDQPIQLQYSFFQSLSIIVLSIGVRYQFQGCRVVRFSFIQILMECSRSFGDLFRHGGIL